MRARASLPPLLATLCAAALPAQADPLAAAAREIAAVEAAGGRVSAIVVDPSDGRVLFRHRAEEALLPASNVKLATAAAALARLGADFEFATTFRLRSGWLEVEPAADPSWSAGTDHDPAAIFARVAAALRERAVVAVAGVRLLQGAFRGPGRHPDWAPYDEALPYCAPTGGLVLEAGCVEARIAAVPGEASARVEIVAPRVSMPIEGAIKLTDDRKAGSVFGLAEAGGRLRAYGALFRRAPERIARTAVRDPALVFELALVQALADGGVRVDPLAAPPDADVHVHRSPLRAALGPMLLDSSNFHAEQVARALGAVRDGDGSLEGGARAVAAELAALVGDWRGLCIADASGLSRENRMPAAALGALLVRALASPWGGMLAEHLPGGGEGTLRRRFGDLGGRVEAKTGTLRDALALSGFARGMGARRIVFAILVNGKGGHGAWRRAQDALVAAAAALAQ
jgi:D-alanyl-D-alanine carboxypeptidase/D-alanyl-D-alanine-endopeptidase (penicillin-binding protein 4)